MRSEKKFWGILLLASAAFIIVLTFSLMRIIYPLHVEQMKQRARETMTHMLFVLPHLTPVLRQEYLEKILRSTDDVSYLLLMDINGNAIAHSNPLRVGMNFNDPGFRRCINEKIRIEQIYVRDADNSSSPYHGEVTLDILNPYYSEDGTVSGAVNVGVSLAAIQKAKNTYIIISAIGAVLWTFFISIFAFSHFRTLAMKKKSDEALVESEKQYRFLIENQSDIAYSIDTLGRISFIGIQIRRYGLNPSEMAGQPIQKYIYPPDYADVYALIIDAFKTENTSEAAFRMPAADGREIWFETKGSIIRDNDGTITGLSGMLRDVTDKKKLEEQLRQSQKMDVIGQLAGGIAHDFNNMLGGIIGSAEMLSIKLPDDSPLKIYASTILKGAERAAELTKNLLAYSRKGKIISTIIDIHEPIKDSIELLERTIDRRIEIRTDFMAEDPSVTGDPALLQNAFLNLGVNARDAMPDGGILLYSTKNVTIDGSIHPGLVPGRYIEITVSDTGKGVPHNIIDRIFEPFFSTKEFGKGTGLGLAAVYGTIKEHRGEITVQSDPETGSIFKILVPVEGKTVISSPGFDSDIVYGTGCILFIDDEAIIRNIAHAQLIHMGYDVILAGDGEEGVELFKKEIDRISLVIIDLVMPKISGQETLRRILAIAPSTKIILVSGFNYYEKDNQLIDLGAAGFIQKPFQISELSRLIAKIITGTQIM
ncbi:MAG TPA: response regulator [Spirochaetota bacterium]|nr:response regulator [Spirochaetota bacterium]HPS88139.1 response regulator [Spirochaetota bacterium]